MAEPSIYDTNAPLLTRGGYFPTVVAPGTKVPSRYVPSLGEYQPLSHWQIRKEPISTPQPGAGIGVRCGDGLVAIDFDDEDAALEISEAFDPSSVNKVGKRGWTSCYRADFPVPSADVFDKDGVLVLQILSAGKHTVIPPSIHPDTKQPYRYTNGHSLQDTPLSELPPFPRDYRERIEALGYSFGKQKPEKPPKDLTETPDSDDPFRALNDAALANRPAWVPALNLYKCKRNVGFNGPYTCVASWRPSTKGHKLEDRAPNLKIHKSGIVDFGDGRTYTPLDLVMAAKGWPLSRAFEWLEAHVSPKPEVDVDFDKIAQDKATSDTKAGPEVDGDARVYGRIRLIPYDAIPPEKLERRHWLYRRHYLGGTVSSTVGDSGIGKTSLSLVEIVGLAIGRDLLGDEKLRPHRCWYHNGEDTRGEINLRLGAICEYYKLNQAEVRRNLTITCGLDMPVEVAAGSPPTIDKELVQDIANAIMGEGYEVAVFDPLITMHQVNENGTEIRTVLRNVFARVANFTGCAIELPHHTRKLFPGVEEATADDARGSTEIKAAVRGMRMASLMTKAEAELYQVPETERLSYFKTYSAKANMTKRGNVFWYKIEGHELPNGIPEENIPGENVGVVTRWNCPVALDPLTLYDFGDKKFWHQAAMDGAYRYDRRAADWFGYVISERLKLKARTNSEHKRQAAAILEALLEEGVLKTHSEKVVGQGGKAVVWVVAGEAPKAQPKVEE
jgi:hypothetical protein